MTRARERVQHGGNFFEVFDDGLDGTFGEELELLGDVKLCPEFCGTAERDADESLKIQPAALVAFSDI